MFNSKPKKKHKHLEKLVPVHRMVLPRKGLSCGGGSQEVVVESVQNLFVGVYFGANDTGLILQLSNAAVGSQQIQIKNVECCDEQSDDHKIEEQQHGCFLISTHTFLSQMKNSVILRIPFLLSSKSVRVGTNSRLLVSTSRRWAMRFWTFFSVIPSRFSFRVMFW